MQMVDRSKLEKDFGNDLDGKRQRFVEKVSGTVREMAATSLHDYVLS